MHSPHSLIRNFSLINKGQIYLFNNVFIRNLSSFPLRNNRMLPQLSLLNINNYNTNNNLHYHIFKSFTSNQNQSTNNNENKDNNNENNSTQENNHKNNANETPSMNTANKDNENRENTNQKDIEDSKIVKDLKEEVNKFRNIAARAQADLINYQKIAQRDVQNAKEYSITKFSKDLLSVLDALESAIKTINIDNVNKNSELKALFEGIGLTQKTLLDTFSRNGIKIIDSLGKPFNPNFHEALFKQPSDKHEADVITHVLSQGYTIEGRILRPARVGVSSGLSTEQTNDTKINEEEDEGQNKDEKK